VFANSSSLRVLWLNKSLVKFSFKIKASEWNSCWIVELSRLLHAQFLEFCPIQEASRPLPLLKQVNANTWNWKCLRCCVSTVWKRCLLTNWWATWINWGVSNQETLHGRLQVVTTLSAWSGVWWSTCCKFSCVSQSISFQWLLVMVLVEREWRCREEHFEITGIDPPLCVYYWTWNGVYILSTWLNLIVTCVFLVSVLWKCLRVYLVQSVCLPTIPHFVSWLLHAPPLQSNLANATLVYTTHFCATQLFGSKLALLYDNNT
jgi:hypothetical protein